MPLNFFYGFHSFAANSWYLFSSSEDFSWATGAERQESLTVHSPLGGPRLTWWGRTKLSSLASRQHSLWAGTVQSRAPCRIRLRLGTSLLPSLPCHFCSKSFAHLPLLWGLLKEPGLKTNIYFHLLQIFTEYLLSAKPHSRCWGYSRKQSKSPVLKDLSF